MWISSELANFDTDLWNDLKKVGLFLKGNPLTKWVESGADYQIFKSADSIFYFLNHNHFFGDHRQDLTQNFNVKIVRFDLVEKFYNNTKIKLENQKQPNFNAHKSHISSWATTVFSLACLISSFSRRLISTRQAVEKMESPDVFFLLST